MTNTHRMSRWLASAFFLLCCVAAGCTKFGVRHATIEERVEHLQPIVETLKREANE